MDLNHRNMRRLLGVVAFGVILFVGLWHLPAVTGALGMALGTLLFFFAGLSIAFILNSLLVWMETRLFSPLNRRLGRRWQRVRRPLSVLLTVVLVLSLVVLVVFMVIPELARTFSVIADEIPAFIVRVDGWVAEMSAQHGGIVDTLRTWEVDWAKIGSDAINLLQNGATSLISGTVTAATSIVSAVFNLIIGIILAVYILLSKEKLGRQARSVLYAFLPRKRVDGILRVGATANRVFSSFISGQLLESVILGTLFFIGMNIFGFPFAPAVSLLVGVTAVIPIFGAFLGVFVGAFMILVQGGIVQMLWFILFFVALQQIEGNLIYPHVVGKSVMLPGLWVLVAVTLGSNVAGILGMLLSVPLCALVYALLKEAVARRNGGNKSDDALTSCPDPSYNEQDFEKTES